MPNRKSQGQKWLKHLLKLILDFGLAKVRVRLSFERVYDDQTDKGRSPSPAGEAATSAGRADGRASAIIRCGQHHVQADADRLCPRVES